MPPARKSQDDPAVLDTTSGQPIALIGIAPFNPVPLKTFLDLSWPYQVPELGIRLWVKPVVGMVQKGSAAERAGLKIGDLILAINDEPVDHWYQMNLRIASSYTWRRTPRPAWT